MLCYLKCIYIYVLSASVKQFIVKKPDKFFIGKPSQNWGGATNSIIRVQNSELVSENIFVPPVRTSWDEYTMLVMHNYAVNHKS